MTPLLAASVTGHNHIVEYLIEQESLVCRAERIEALELLGATYVDKKRDMIGALELWKRAMALRYGSWSTVLAPRLEASCKKGHVVLSSPRQRRIFTLYQVLGWLRVSALFGRTHNLCLLYCHENCFDCLIIITIYYGIVLLVLTNTQ